MISISEIEYPLRLCVELLLFSTRSCKKTENMKYSELEELLLRFFDEDQIIKAQDILSGVCCYQSPLPIKESTSGKELR